MRARHRLLVSWVTSALLLTGCTAADPGDDEPAAESTASITPSPRSPPGRRRERGP